MIVMATTTPHTERRGRTIQEILPPYSVILHNDHHHTMDYVVAALLKSIPSLTAEEAVNIMLEAHNSGQAVVITCPLEQSGVISRPDQQLWPWGDHREGVTPQFLDQRMTPLNSPGNELR
jgi:ATP-dependent Clp protease adaptor protein ClpS